ncbi:hypothetical protein EDC04DRAFT_2608821 [Pisolithus marmoratus]|nr:hypothetical protein EDC04DRAFT_2608821 [Pisolithus marmoratus]
METIDKKLLEVKETYIQYKRATQEKKNMANYDNQQKYLLNKAWEKGVKVLDAISDKLAKHPQRKWLLDHFTSNTPNLTLPDDDNAKLYQVLNILAMLKGRKKKNLGESAPLRGWKLKELPHTYPD